MLGPEQRRGERARLVEQLQPFVVLPFVLEDVAERAIGGGAPEHVLRRRLRRQRDRLARRRFGLGVAALAEVDERDLHPEIDLQLAGAAGAAHHRLGEAHPLVRVGKAVQVDGDVGQLDGDAALELVEPRFLGGVERVAPRAIGALVVARLEAQLADERLRLGDERTVAELLRHRRHCFRLRQPVLVLAGAEARARRRQLRALVGQRGAQARIGRRRRHRRQRLDVRAHRDRRQRRDRLDRALDRFIVGGDEELGERGQLLLAIVEAAHAQLHDRFGLVAAQPRRRARVAVRRRPRARVAVEGARGLERRLRRPRLAALGERALHRLAPRRIPDARQMALAAFAHARPLAAEVAHDEQHRRRRHHDRGRGEEAAPAQRRIVGERGEQRVHRRPALLLSTRNPRKRMRAHPARHLGVGGRLAHGAGEDAVDDLLGRAAGEGALRVERLIE